MKKNRLILAVLTVIAIVIATSMNTLILIAEDDAFTITIGDVDGKPGEDIEIPIIFKNVPKKGLLNCDFGLIYDPDVLEIKSIEAGEIIINPSGSFDTGIDEENKTILFLFSEDSGEGLESIFEDGVFAIINASIKSDVPSGKSSIEFDYLGGFVDIDFKKTVPSQTVEGKVEVVGGTTATPKGSSTVDPDTTPVTTPETTSTPVATVQPTPTPMDSENTHYAYLSGYPGGLFKPENNITRAEAAVIFAKLSGAAPDTVSNSNGIVFTDISESHWATWAIK